MSIMFGLRFDLRNPTFAATSMADRYAAALDMAEWADGLGCLTITLSEHHGSDDGYLPSPLVMAAAMAARTTHVRFMIGALVAPFYDPARLADDVAVLQDISRGRVDLIIGAGYVRSEFARYRVPMRERVARVEAAVAALRALQSPPTLLLGGSSEPAARRAARIGDGFIPSIPEVWDFYREELVSLGRPDPGPYAMPASTTTALAEDVEIGWQELGPYFLHEANAYGAWLADNDGAGPYARADDIASLRAGDQYRVVTPDDYAVELREAPLPFALLHPMCGGIPPDLAWQSLRLFEERVLARQ